MLPLLQTFLELLLWNSFQCHGQFFFFFGMSEMFAPLRRTLFLETAGSHFGELDGWVFDSSNRILGQKLLDRERLVSWSAVMVKNPIVGAKFRPFSTHSFE
jgi:hypothetical protein